MSNIKEIFIMFIAVSAISQICRLLLHNTAFDKSFKTISGIVTIVIIFTAISSNNISINQLKLNDITKMDYDEDIAINTFKSNLSNKISDDLHKKFYVNCIVDVETDMSYLKIIISGNIAIDKVNSLKQYVTDTYCTPRDEVIIKNDI